MQSRPVDILLVEPDRELAGMMQECLQDAIPGSLTTVSDATAALREELTTRHHVLLISTDLPDAGWIDLAREIRVTNKSPLIVLAEDPSVSDMAEAIHLGAMEVLVKPFDLAEMTDQVRRAGQRAIARRRQRIRTRRLRRLTSKIIRERRDLRERIDLICRDFVQAYRRLAQRVSEADLLSHK